MDDADVADATQDFQQTSRRSNPIRPVTIRQLTQTDIKEGLARNGSEFRYILHDEEFHIATFVGNIVSVAISGENTRTIRIEDGTGTITSTLTIGNDQEAEDPPRWRVGAYARVFGVPRSFNEAVFFNIYFIRPVEDPHEVLFHLMEAMAVTLQHSRGRPPPRLYDSRFAATTGSQLPPLAAEPDLSMSTRSLVLNSPQLQSRPLLVASTSRVADTPRDDSVESDQLDSTKNVETTDIRDTSDDDGSTEYYTDQLPGSPLERSPSPTPVRLFARNHSFEGHAGREEGPSSQLSQSTQRPEIRSSDEESEDGQTPRGKSKLRRRDNAVPKLPTKSSDDELEVLRSEFSSQVVASTPPRKLKPDPYARWSPAKRNIMLSIRSKTPGEEVNVRKVLSEGMSKMEMKNAVRELVREGEIETGDGINYRLTDKGPKYPRF